MFETSKDILNLVLAISIVGISIFICWLLYYIIASIKKIHNTLNLFQKALGSFNDLMINAKKKLQSSAAYFKLAGMLVGKIAEEIKNRNIKKGKTNTKASRNKKTKDSENKR